MSRLDTSIADAYSASWWDRAATLSDPWGDELERAAMVLHEARYETPETVTSSLANVKACAAMAERWRGLPAPTRHLYRRRAALAFEAGQRKPTGAK
jgi:hypothetical protein